MRLLTIFNSLFIFSLSTNAPARNYLLLVDIDYSSFDYSVLALKREIIIVPGFVLSEKWLIFIQILKLFVTNIYFTYFNFLL